MRTFPVVTDLPTDMMQAIGRVIVEYSFLELQLSRIIYDLLRVNPKAGRLAVSEPRSTQRLETIFDLAELKGLLLKKDQMKRFRDAVETCLVQRDQLAHGVWVRDPKSNKLMLRLTKGQWQPIKGQRGKTKRLVRPEAVSYTARTIKGIGDVINLTTRSLVDLRNALPVALRSSRARRDAQSPRDGHTRNRTHTSRLPPPQSSPG